MFFVFQFGATIISIASPIPSGIFMPSLKMGALLGRLFGEIVRSLTEV